MADRRAESRGQGGGGSRSGNGCFGLAFQDCSKDKQLCEALERLGIESKPQFLNVFKHRKEMDAERTQNIKVR